MDTNAQGKLIVITGSPATGKTFLAEKLTERLGAELIYEYGKDGLPKEITDNLNNQKNLFETIVWFRNLQVNNYQRAIDLTLNSKTVILDSPFYHNQLYIDLYISDEFQKNTLYKMGEIDWQNFRQPDYTLYIHTTSELMIKFLDNRSGKRSWEDQKWKEFIIRMPPLVSKYIFSVQSNIPNLFTIERENYDFSKQEDLQLLINKSNLNI